MSDPIRYTGKIEGWVLGSPHWEHPEGEWVKYEDYARLKAEVERLRTAGDTLVAAYCMGDRNKERWAEYPVVREWLRAKGELQ